MESTVKLSWDICQQSYRSAIDILSFNFAQLLDMLTVMYYLIDNDNIIIV